MESQPAPTPRRFLQGPLFAATLALGAIVALTAGFIWTNRLALAEYAAVAILTEIGVAPATLTVDALALDGATVTDIVLGPQRISRIEATYSLSGLRRGRIDRLRIAGVRLRARWRDGALTLPGLMALIGGPGGGPAMIEAIAVEGFRIAVDTANGTAILEGERAEAGFVDGDSEFRADVTIRSPSGDRATGRLEATLFSGGEILGRFTVREGKVATPHGAASAVRGAVQFIVGAAGPELDARFDIARLVIGERTMRNVRIAVAAKGTLDDIAIDGQLETPAGRIQLRGTLRRSLDGAVRFEGTGAVLLALDDIQAAVTGGLRLKRTPRGDLSGDLKIETARLGYKEHSLAGIDGTAAFTRPRAGEATLEATLEFQRLRVPGFDGPTGTLTLALNGRRIVARGQLHTPGGRLALDARGVLGGPLDYKTTGRLAIGPLLAALESTIQGRGSVAFDLAGTVADPFDFPANLADAVTVTGSVDVTLDDIAVPGLLRGGAARGSIGVSARPGDWRFTSDALWLSAASLAPGILAPLPNAVRERLDGGVRLTVSAPTTLRIAPLADRYATALSGAIRLDAKDIALNVRGTFESTREPWTAAGRYGLEGAHRGTIVDVLAPLTLTARLSGGFTLADNILAIDAGPDSRVMIAAIVVPDLLRTRGPLILAPAKTLRARFSLTGTPRLLAFEGAVSVMKNRLAITAGTTTIDIDVAPLTLRISGGQDEFRLAIDDGALAAPVFGIRAKGISLALRDGDDTAFTLTIDEITQRGPDPIVVPLRLNVNATRRKGQIEFSGRLFDAPERLSVRASGRHDIAKNSGAASFDLDPLAFLPTVLQPRQLFPVLGNSLREVDGRIGGHARLQWQAGVPRSSASLFVELRSLDVEGAALENVAATITFDSLFPLSTPPNQEIHIGLLDIGVPLTQGRVEFQIQADGAIRAALRELDFFGGRIETDTIAIPSNLDGFSIPLRVTGVRLESLFALAEIGGLEATGTLNGTLPLVIVNGVVALRHGVLESAPGGGAIRYRPQSIGPALADANEGMKLFLQLVHDFTYDSVRVTLDEDPSGGVSSRFEIRGSNATVYDGIPVELNISMSGPLRDILHQSIKTYTLPERLLTRIQGAGDTERARAGN